MNLLFLDYVTDALLEAVYMSLNCRFLHHYILLKGIWQNSLHSMVNYFLRIALGVHSWLFRELHCISRLVYIHTTCYRDHSDVPGGYQIRIVNIKAQQSAFSKLAIRTRFK